MRTLFLKLVMASFALLAIQAFAGAQTTEPVNVYLMSRLLNFTRGQAVSLNFTNVDRVTRDAALYIVDTDGNTLRSATARVAPGQTVGLNFTFGELSRVNSTRVGLRGVVVLAQPPEPDVEPPTADLSLGNIEVYDVPTGKTTFGLLLPAVRSLNVYFPQVP
jgi:hypothetical protein